jgi:KTSC domain-containing protein
MKTDQKAKRIRPVLGVIAGVLAILAYTNTSVRSEDVDVKYRGTVNLSPFQCTDVTRSSFIRRVCYDRRNEYMLINLNGTFYHYCEIESGTVSSLLEAPSMGRFYNASIKGHFDCRLRRVPTY